MFDLELQMRENTRFLRLQIKEITGMKLRILIVERVWM